MSTEADLLRRAATRLRELAAGATPGPWTWTGEQCWTGEEECHDHPHPWGHMGPDLDSGNGESVIGSFGHDADGVVVSRGDAAWVAALNPTLAQPLAVWLEEVAREVDSSRACMASLGQYIHVTGDDEALALARTLLGETEEAPS